MTLPDNVNLTRKGRAILEFLNREFERTKAEPSISDIERECNVAHDTAVRWRQIWRRSQGSTEEAPPPTVQRRVESRDPLEVFGRPNRTPEPDVQPTPEPDVPGPVQSDGAPKEEPDVQSDDPRPERSDVQRKDRTVVF